MRKLNPSSSNHMWRRKEFVFKLRIVKNTAAVIFFFFFTHNSFGFTCNTKHFKMTEIQSPLKFC